jgi:hypothetical protein
MKIRRLLLVSFVILIVSTILASCTENVTDSTEPTTNITQTTSAEPTTTVTTTPEIVTPTPIPPEPNTGHAIGLLLYTDNTPASHVSVYIFEADAFMSKTVVWTNVSGYYLFESLPVGDYEIYGAIYKDYSLSTPDAIITVCDQQTTEVPTIIVPRYIELELGEEYNTGEPITCSSQDVI